jgi:protein-tyrosine kinase
MSRIFDALNREGTQFGDLHIDETPAPEAAPDVRTAPQPAATRGKIFEALSQEQSDFPDLLRPVLEADVPEAEPVISAASAVPPEPIPPPKRAILPREEATAFPQVSLRIPATVPLLPFDGGQSRASEEYRLMRTRIRQHSLQPRMILVSSPSPCDGKTVTAINIAGALALKSETRALVIDVDFPRSSIHLLTGISRTPGLAEVLSGRASLTEAVVQVKQLPNLYILPAGETLLNPAELFDSPTWPVVCETLRGRFDYVILDSPPVEAVPYYGQLQAASDGVIVVIRPDHTQRSGLAKVMETISKEQLIGFVVNCTTDWFLTRDYRNYRYRHGYGWDQRVSPAEPNTVEGNVSQS